MKNRFTLWAALISLSAVCIFLINIIYKSSQENKNLSNNILQLQSTLSLKPKIIKIDSIIYKDRIFNVYKTPQISQNDTASKILAVGNVKKLDSLNKALNTTTKDLLSYKEINTKLTIENKKLQSNLTNPSKVEYRDKYITLVIDRENNVIDTLTHKISLISSSYMKRPKWYKGKEEYYVLSADDKRVTLDVTGFDTKPKNMVSSLYLDTKYQLNPSTLSGGQLSSTLNYEMGMDNVVSSYFGGGMQTNFIDKPQGVVTAGIKVNILRIKK